MKYIKLLISQIVKYKADFGGVHIPLEQSKKDAVEFIANLKNHLAKHLVVREVP